MFAQHFDDGGPVMYAVLAVWVLVLAGVQLVMLGIIGSMLSGISMANARVLIERSVTP